MNDELRRAISIAQTAHDRNDGPADATAVSIGALIRAVTILAGERPTSREETRDAGVDDSFSGDLVKGLIEAFVRGTKNGVLPTGEGIRAILSELASMPCELPNEKAILQAMRDEICGWGEVKAVEFTRKRIAHFLTAQKARIADLEQHAATLEGLAKQYKGERDHVEETCKMQRERIDELTTANNGYRQRATEGDAAIAELEKRLEDMEAKIAELEKCLSEPKVLDGWPTYHDITAAWFGSTGRICVESSERMIDLFKRRCVVSGPCFLCGYTKAEVHQKYSAPADDFGKSPGRMLRSLLGSILRAGNDVDGRLESAAEAVLRAFGGAEALRRVRVRLIANADESGELTLSFAKRAIDDELAKLTHSPPDVSTESGLPDPVLVHMNTR